jgi:hypothetical protein
MTFKLDKPSVLQGFLPPKTYSSGLRVVVAMLENDTQCELMAFKAALMCKKALTYSTIIALTYILFQVYQRISRALRF